MGMANDIEIIKRQEEALQFSSFSEHDAWALGSIMRQAALERKLPLVMDLRIGTRQLFYAAMPGTAPDNQEWVKRKINTVYRFEMSSYRIGLEYKQRGAGFDMSRGIDPQLYAPAGGGFPIRMGGAVVGVVTVSGIPQRDDHGFVVASLAAHLGIDPHDIALPQGDD